MKPGDAELILRQLDGKATPEEHHKVTELLRTDPSARALMREIAEQAIMIGDLERTAAVTESKPAARGLGNERKVVPVPFRWQYWLAAAATVVGAIYLAVQFFPGSRTPSIRVSTVIGSAQFIGARGQQEQELTVGARLQAGDALETRAADAWIELELPDHSRMTLAGHSSLRVLEGGTGTLQLRLNRGSLWVNSSNTKDPAPLKLQTPSASIESAHAQFDLHACGTETTLRVNGGSARVKPSLGGKWAELKAGFQGTTSLRTNGMTTTLQPSPVTAWSCDLWTVHEVILGRWLPADGTVRGRLGAEPLFWPIPNREPLLLHIVALSVVQSSDQPVLLQHGATLRFQGRTSRPEMVRFGFSTQKMRGAFAGKFEVDVPPESLGPSGKTWTVSLPLSVFRPVGSQPSPSPEGLELSDVYALTLIEDADLEIHHVELLPDPKQ